MTDAPFKSGQTAVVTGAALGIGRALARRFARDGMNVVMADLPGEDFEAALAEVQGIAPDRHRVLGVATDVSDEAEVAHLLARCETAFGACHVLVNNAVTRIGRGHDAPLSHWRQAMDVNLFGPVMMVRAFLPLMQQTAGPRAIVNVGSKQGITNPPGHPVYNMTKSALKTYTEALAHELRNAPSVGDADAITVHLLVPGWTTTGHAEHKPGAWLPDQVVDRMITHVRAGDFYIICPDGEVTEDIDRRRIAWAASDISENRPALSRWHQDWAERAAKACN